jgi:deoxyadenosine/deoxycytidine kinase
MLPFKVGIVGPCGSGKTTLTAGLKHYGYNPRPIAQEHSYVPTMWQRLTNPDILIYLSVSYPLTIERRKLDWTEKEYAEQLHRLRHAREHADLCIDTDRLTPQGVLDQALKFLQSR